MIFKDVPLRVKKQMNTNELYTNYFVMSCNTAIPFDVNTLKNSNVFLFFTEFSSTYYNDKVEAFGVLFREYIKSSLQNIGHPVLTK